MTSMTSASLTVESLWAMTNDVLPTIMRSMASCILLSVRVSTELVASSRMIIGASFTMALAIASCCLCPAESPEASPTTVSNPSGSARIYSPIPTESHALSTSSLPAPLVKATFS